jgi:hypothetical protein
MTMDIAQQRGRSKRCYLATPLQRPALMVCRYCRRIDSSYYRPPDCLSKPDFCSVQQCQIDTVSHMPIT